MHKYLTLLLATALLFAFTACSKNNQSDDPLADLANIPSPVCQYSPKEDAFLCPKKDYDNIKNTLAFTSYQEISINIVATVRTVSKKDPFLHRLDSSYICTLHLIKSRYGSIGYAETTKRTDYYLCREDFNTILKEAYNLDFKKNEMFDILNSGNWTELPTQLNSGFYQSITDKTPVQYLDIADIQYKKITAN